MSFVIKLSRMLPNPRQLRHLRHDDAFRKYLSSDHNSLSVHFVSPISSRHTRLGHTNLPHSINCSHKFCVEAVII